MTSTLRATDKAEPFINKAGTMPVVEEMVITGDEIRRFCNALELPPNITSRHIHHWQSAYMVMREWFNMRTRTMHDLAIAFHRFAPALVSKLNLTPFLTGGGAAPATPTYNDVYETLTPDDKQSVLMAAGCAPGEAATVAARGPADFWAKLEHRGAIREPDIWRCNVKALRLMCQMRGWECTMEENMPPVMSERDMAARSFAPSNQSVFQSASSAFTRKKREETLRDVMCAGEPIDAVLRVTSALDHSEKWLDLLGKLNVEPSEAVAQRILELKELWKQGHSPSRAVLRELCEHDAEVAGMSLGDFITILLNLGDASVSTEAVRWSELRGAADTQHKKKQTAVFDAKLELTNFFLENEIATQENVHALVAALAGKEFGATTVKSLRLLDKNDLVCAGFSRAAAALVLKVLAE